MFCRTDNLLQNDQKPALSRRSMTRLLRACEGHWFAASGAVFDRRRGREKFVFGKSPRNPLTKSRIRTAENPRKSKKIQCSKSGLIAAKRRGANENPNRCAETLSLTIQPSSSPVPEPLPTKSIPPGPRLTGETSRLVSRPSFLSVERARGGALLSHRGRERLAALFGREDDPGSRPRERADRCANPARRGYLGKSA